MGRIDLSKPRTIGTMQVFVGKTIIFCEGFTEYNYINGFAQVLNAKSKFTNVDLKIENAEGNARTVLDCANTFFGNEENRKKYYNYDTYLMYDCDDPTDIESVITESLKSEYKYKLLITNFLFEVWLLMHFEEVDKKISKSEIEDRLKFHLNLEYYRSKEKANNGLIRQIISTGKVNLAIENAERLEKTYSDYNLELDIKKMNPYTSVHKLMEKISDEFSRLT